jgi:preprotein translocase subunit Sec61beta
MRPSEEEIMKVKFDTMLLISATIAVAIWVLIIWTAIAAIVAHS